MRIIRPLDEGHRAHAGIAITTHFCSDWFSLAKCSSLHFRDVTTREDIQFSRLSPPLFSSPMAAS